MQAKFFIKMLPKFLLLAVLSPLLAAFLTPFWSSQTAYVHTGLELIRLFIIICSFLIVFSVHKQNDQINVIIGLGLLMVGIFDLFHIFFHQDFSWSNPDYYDLSVRYWILGRFMEALVFLAAAKTCGRNINTYLGAAVAILSALGLSLIVLKYRELFPVLLSENSGLTPLKIVLEYIIIALYLLSIFFLFRKARLNAQAVVYNYLLIALFFAIPAEICFTLYNHITDYSLILGHVLKIFSYYFIFRGIFVSSVTFPYNELKTTQKKMKRIFNHFPMALVCFDQESKITFVNTRAQNILGCPAKDIINLTVNAFLLKFNFKWWNTEELPPNEDISQNNTTSKRYLCDIVDSTGRKRILELRIESLGQHGFIYLFEEAKKEQELTNLQLQTKTLMDSLDSAVLLCTKTNLVIGYNHKALEIMRVRERDLLGKNLIELLKTLTSTAEDYEFLANNNWENKKKCRQPFELEFLGDNKEKRYLSGSICPVLNVEGELTGSIVVFRDITETEKMYQILLEQEKFVALGQTAAGIVHEIKNPLTSIKGFNQMILARTKEDITREFSEIIHEEIESLNMVISDFLAFAKPRKPVVKELILSDLVKSIQAMIEPQLFMKGIDFELVLPEKEYKVLVDDAQLKQVVLNLVKNAVEALEAVENPKLWIILELLEESGEMKIGIKDNGKGIPKEYHDKIGTPFFTTKEKGTGLGLSICHQIVKENKGKLTFESEVNKGTTFCILLPCAESCKLNLNTKTD